MNKPKFIWDESTGEATCWYPHPITGKIYEGKAHCNIIDNDFKSEKIGCCIAETRAILQIMRDERDKTAASLKTLKHLYETMEQGWHEDKPNHQMILTKREIIRKEVELKEYRENIQKMTQALHTYITDKEKFHEKIRKNRQVNNN